MLWSLIHVIFKTSSVTNDFFYVFNLILSFSTCSQSFKKICTWEFLGANVLKYILKLLLRKVDSISLLLAIWSGLWLRPELYWTNHGTNGNTRLFYFALRVGFALIELSEFSQLSITFEATTATEIRQTMEFQTEPIAWGNWQILLSNNNPINVISNRVQSASSLVLKAALSRLLKAVSALWERRNWLA